MIMRGSKVRARRDVRCGGQLIARAGTRAVVTHVREDGAVVARFDGKRTHVVTVRPSLLTTGGAR